MLWIEKSVTRDYSSASFGKSRDANQCPCDRFFIPHQALMKDTRDVTAISSHHRLYIVNDRDKPIFNK